MRRAIAFGTILFSFCVLATNAGAETIVVTTTTISTSGTFDCRATVVCSGEGTDTVTFGSGANTATLRFLGVNSTFEVTNTAVPVTLGIFDLTASDGFTFPTHQVNPQQLPIVRFFFTMTQTEPVLSNRGRLWEFGPGGHETLPIEIGSSYVQFPVGPTPYNYNGIVYSLNPFPLTLVPGSTSLTADVGAVPEPATMVLLGTGLIGAAAAARRRKVDGRP